MTKRSVLVFFAGITSGVVGLVGLFVVAAAYYVEAVRFPTGVPRVRPSSLPPCDDAMLEWFGGLCADPHADLGIAFSDVEIATARGVTLRGWWIDGRTEGGTAPAVLFAHGAGADRREGLRFVRSVHTSGWAMLLLDLSNHGLSDNDGTGVRYGIIERFDILDAARWLRTHKRPSRLTALGSSLGGASAIMAAAIDDQRLIDAVWAEAPFASIPDLLVNEADRHNVPRFVALQVLDEIREDLGAPILAISPAGAASAIAPRPFMLVVDGQDAIVPASHGDLIFELANPPKRRLDFTAARHVLGFTADPDRYTRELSGFLARVAAGTFASDGESPR